MHSTAPILPPCNYYDNLAHKASECNILFEDLFCDYCEEEGHKEAICFTKFLERKRFRLLEQNLPTSSVALQPKAKAPQPSIQAFSTNGNSSKNVKKKEHNVDKKEVLQAHVVQIQTL
jgi:hypothetical protein